eukprot:2893008-Pleurochrysis_carterae.AAC.1
MIDNHHPEHGGGEKHNLLLDSVYANLLEKCSSGHYAAIIASPPCSTFSVSRFFAAKNAPDGGPPPVRDRENIMGLADVPPSHRRELEQANLLVERTAALLRAARDAGAEYILEHPADRGHIVVNNSLVQDLFPHRVYLITLDTFSALAYLCQRSDTFGIPHVGYFDQTICAS